MPNAKPAEVANEKKFLPPTQLVAIIKKLSTQSSESSAGIGITQNNSNSWIIDKIYTTYPISKA